MLLTEAVCFAAAARACLRLATRYFTPSMARNAVTTAIRMGAVCSAPTWVMNAASSTIENGAARGPRDGGEQAGERQSQRHAGNHLVHEHPGRSPMNSAGKMGPPTKPLAWLTAKVSIFAITSGDEQADAEGSAR